MSDDEKLDLIGCGVYMGSRWSKQNTIDEFEKIKAEIKQQGSIHVKYRRTEDIDHLVDSIVYQCKDSFCNYIDNHIKELKGEKNETCN